MPVDHLMTPMQTIGNYELVEKIAEGGMGTVFKGRNLTTGDVVAVKVVPPHLLANPVVVKRFEQEYNVARQIDHPNIVKALDFGREGDTRYLVMEYVEGESLGQKIERDGRMNEEEAIAVITQVAQALQKAHKLGVIHRDVKPDNVLITPTGQVKLTDLGLVKELEADLNLTRTGRGLGTPHFMAPEQFRNAKKADVRCDVYSLGATLYMMVTGELPFRSTNGPLDAWMKKINNELDAPRKLVPRLSDRLDWAIRRAMSPDPVRRPESCREFVEDLTGQSVKRLSCTQPPTETIQEYWYLVYTDEEETVHTVKGTTPSIRRSLKDGLLGDTSNIKMSRSKAGPFESVRSYAEFRDLVVQPAKLPPVEAKSTVKPMSAVAVKQSSSAASTMTKKPASASSETKDPLGTTMIAPPNYASSSSGSFNTSSLSGPRINITTTPSSSGEVWKWVGLALLFGGTGMLAAVVMPWLRQMRWF